MQTKNVGSGDILGFGNKLSILLSGNLWCVRLEQCEIECKYFTKASGGSDVVLGVCLESDGLGEHAGTKLVACFHHALVVCGGFESHQAQFCGCRVILHRQARAQLPPKHPEITDDYSDFDEKVIFARG